VSANGTVSQGVSLSAAPWSWIPGIDIDLNQYQRSRAKYLLANTQFSLGTANNPGDSASTDVGFGLRVVLFDRADVMADSSFTNALRIALVNANCPIALPGEDTSAQLACLEKARNAFTTSYRSSRHRGWNALSLAIAAAGGMRLPESKVENPSWLGWSGWITGSYPVSSWGQLIGQLQYDANRRIVGSDRANLLSYGMRGTGGGTAWGLYGEVTGTYHASPAPGQKKSRVEWSGGIEIKVGAKQWLSTGFGRGYQEFGEPDRTFLLANLRMGLATSSRFRS